MKNTHYILISLILSIAWLAFPPIAVAQEMVIDAADPNSGEQGSSNYAVDIIGSGFDDTVTEVRFILNCGKKNCPDTGEIIVNTFNVDSPTQISTNINILQNATVADFDIAVRSTRGRGGKGTTYFGLKKFSVKVRPNQEFVQCTEFAPLGTCDCQFIRSEDGNIHNPVADCSTSETLFVDDKRIHNADPNVPFVLTAIPDINGVFHGSAVIANGDPSVAGSGSHRGGVRGITFEFDGLLPRGCGAGELRTALSLVLDYPMVSDPRIPDPLNRNAFLRAWESTIDSTDDPLCYAIEVVRTQAYTDAYSAPGDPEPARDWKTSVSENVIAPGSYVRAGIRYVGIMPSETINPPAVVNNVIGASGCEEKDTAAAIEFGSFVAIDPLDQVEGVVENNDIDMSNDCGSGLRPYGTGIDVLGEPGGSQTNAKVSKNVVTGAMTAVMVDGNVVRATFSGNTLTGDDDPATADTGILSAAQCTEFKGKPDKISDFNVSEDHSGCP